jgi:3',5'-cyclic AMP phosphodiesterase CpdA
MNIAWATDVHLDHVDEDEAQAFCRRANCSGAEALLLGGDIANALTLSRWLAFLDEQIEIPTYFVLGNHDYYGGGIAGVQEMARHNQTARLRWLPTAGVVALDERTALVGHGGWGDGQLGDFFASPVILNDYIHIAELRDAGVLPGTRALDSYGGFEDKPALKRILRDLGKRAAQQLQPVLIEALERFEVVVVLTHVPPFREACWHAGEISNDQWLPAFTCKATGDLLAQEAARHANRRVTVLCGHTHGSGESRPLPNLHVITGGAEYGRPEVRVLEI